MNGACHGYRARNGLDHAGAMVAREYGIPAVASVHEVTRRLRTGQRVRVDGSNGQVIVPEGSG